MKTGILSINFKLYQLGSFPNNLNNNAFFFKYKKIIYIITLHHNLPINNIKLNDNDLDIHINSQWSEVLILNINKNINLLNYNIYNKFYIRLPKINDVTYINYNNRKISLQVINIIFLPFNDISNFLLPYILLKGHTNIDNKSIGYPIFIKNKIIGIISKYDTENDLLYVLPIYIVIKNLLKKDNSNIYNISSKHIKITKINYYNVSDNFIFNRNLNIKIPLSTYFLLEGDNKKKVIFHYFYKKIYKKTKKIIIHNNLNFYEIKKLKIDNDDNIIIHGNKCKINHRLLALLRLYNLNSYLNKIFEELNNNNNSNWIIL